MEKICRNRNIKNGLVLLSLVFIFLLAACSSKQETREIELKPYTLTDLAQADFANVDKITIKSGETGELRTFEDKDQIVNFFKSMEQAYFTPDLDQKNREGWLYWVTLYEGKKKVFEFYPHYIDEIYFEPDEKVIESIDGLYHSKSS